MTIQPFVEEYEKSLVFEPTGDHPYLLSMASSYEYGQSSSAWSQLVKSCFQRHSGVACPPKLLRASFCTFLRSADGVDDELLESCAKAMCAAACKDCATRSCLTSPPRVAPQEAPEGYRGQ